MTFFLKIHLIKIVSFFLYSYIFLISWTDAFKIGPWKPVYIVPLIGAVFISILIIVKQGEIPAKIYDQTDLLLVIFLIMVLCFTVIQNNPKTINYLTAYFLVFGLQYLYLKFLFVRYLYLNKILNINSLAVIAVAAFCCAEFLLQLLFNFDIQNFMPRTKAATATMYSGLFARSYGFASEPTVVAFYLNTLGPLCIWHLRKWTFLSTSYWGLFLKTIVYFIIIFG